MPFFPEIDETKTIKRAVRKLKEYQRWRRVAGDVGEQKVTQVFTFEPRGGGGVSKPIESIVARKDEAERELEAIEQAVSGLLDPLQRRLLAERFLLNDSERIKDYAVYTSIGLSHTSYYEERDKALLAFAELYRHGVLLVEK